MEFCFKKINVLLLFLCASFDFVVSLINERLIVDFGVVRCFFKWLICICNFVRFWVLNGQ